MSYRYALLFLLALPLIASAQTDTAAYDRVNLNESASMEIANDLLVVELFAQAEGHDASAPADTVNRQIDWALELAKGQQGIETRTLDYSSHPVYRNNTVRGWRVTQAIRLQSKDSRALGELVGRLQERLQVRMMTYQVSEAQRRAHLDALTEEALDRFNARALHIAQALDRSGFRIVRLSIDDGRDHPTPVARGAMLQSASAEGVTPPRLEAGTQKMTVSVSGEVELYVD
jgi:predicted secreted protein